MSAAVTPPKQPENGAGTRPRLRLAVSVPRLPSPILSPKKDKPSVPSSGRGGLGNIRAAQSHAQSQTSPSALYSPHSPPPLLASTASRSESGSSGTSLHSTSTTSDRRASASTKRSYFSSGKGTGRPVSVDVSVSDFDHHGDETLSDLGSSSSPSFRTRFRESILSTNSANTFGIPNAPGSSTSSVSKSTATRRSSGTSSEYARHLAADAAMRADEKRLQAIDDVMSEQQGDANGNGAKTKKEGRTRTGRGGAGVYRKENKKIDASLFPTTAALTHDHELRLAAQERLLVEASRARAAASRSTGRGGAGNIGAKGKKVSKGEDNAGLGRRKSMLGHVGRSAEAKGKEKESAENLKVDDNDEESAERTHEGTLLRRVPRRSRSVPSISGTASRKRSLHAKSTAHVQRKGLSRLWSRVAGNSVGGRGGSQVSVPVEFEIIEIRPEFEHAEDASGRNLLPGTVEEAGRAGIVGVGACEVPSVTASVSGGGASLARAEVHGEVRPRPQPGEVEEEEAWVDEDQLNSDLNEVVGVEDSDSDIDPACHPSTVTYISKSKSRFSRSALTTRILVDGIEVNIEPDVRASRESVGTFGPKTSVRDEERDVAYADLDDAESIVDPYMRG